MNRQQQATTIYAAYVTMNKAMFARLNAPLEDDFFIDPAKASWLHVNTIKDFTKTIRDICDLTFNEGKYAKH